MAPVSKSSVFVPVLSMALVERHDPDTYYQTRSGLYVWPDFRNHVVAKAKSTEAGKALKLKHQTLACRASDAEIETELGGTHLWNDDDVCAVIAVLIDRHLDGESGVLLDNGYVDNLFYLGSCVVSVDREPAALEWIVRTYRRGNIVWQAGCRVFYPVAD